MNNSTYIIIGALIVVGLIAVLLLRKSKAKKAKPPREPIVAPPADVTPDTPDTVTPTPTLDPVTTPSEPASSTSVEVWNQMDFPVVLTQQGMQVTLPAQGRAHMDSRFPLTATPKTPSDAPYGLSLQSGETPRLLIIQRVD